jgi:hypothetical protein
MSTCTVQTGFLMWKKFCGVDAVGNCRQCHAFVCARHGAAYGDGSLVCAGCSAGVDDDSTGTGFTTSSALLGGAAASTASEQQSSESWHGGGSDSSSSDSGSSDSGGSSSD